MLTFLQNLLYFFYKNRVLKIIREATQTIMLVHPTI